MNDDHGVSERELLRAAWDTAGTFEGATRENPFGPDYDVAKVGGKVFMMTTEVPGRAVVTVKCDPEYAAALRGAHPSIVAGYHMNKRHWISIGAGQDVPIHLIEDLVRDSYDIVRSSLSAKERQSLASTRPAD